MIGYIEGIVISKRRSGLTIKTASGVGYAVYTTTECSEGFKSEDIMGGTSSLALWVYSAVRENSFDLYGFPTEGELALFELLITVSGIGPKTALNIMNAAPASTLRQGITSGDPDYLAKIPGIGKKNAEKIVRELSEKVADLTMAAGEGHETMAHAYKAAQEEQDALEALRGLGWNDKDVRLALAEVAKQHRLNKGSATIHGEKAGNTKTMSASDRVREAMKILGRK